MKALVTFLCTVLTIGQVFTQSTDIRSLYQKGIAEFGNNNFEKAVEYFQQIRKAAPKELTAAEYITICYSRMGKYADAAELSRQLCILAPHNASYFSNACFQLTLANNPKAALAYGKRSVALDNQTYNHQLNLAHAYLLLGKKSQAIYWYLKALEWTASQQEFEQAFSGDFKLLEQLKLIPESSAREYFKELENAWMEAAENPKNLQVLATILSFKDSAFTAKNREMLDSLKMQFIQLESKASVVRYDVLSSFLTDLGLREFENRNWSMALGGYFPLADSMCTRAMDSLGRARLALTLSKELLNRLKVENRLTKNREPVGYALDAYDLVKHHHLDELKTEVLHQLGICYLQLKIPTEAAGIFKELLQWSEASKDSSGMLYAAYGLAQFFELNKDEAKTFYFNKLALDLLDHALVDPETTFEIQQHQLDLLNNRGELKKALQAALDLNSELEKGIGNQYYQSALCEWVGTALLEIKKNDFAKVYFDSAINYYFDYEEKHPASWNRNAPAPIGKEREKSFRLLTYLSAIENNTRGAFFFAECAKDQLLRSYLNKQVPSTPFVIKLEDAQSALEANAAGITYTGTKTNLGTVIAFDRSQSMSKLLDDDQALKLLHDTGLVKTLQQIGSILASIGQQGADSIVAIRSLTLMQYDYLRNGGSAAMRSQMKRKAAVTDAVWTDESASISRVLYELYVKPIEPIIRGKKKLVISPDFILQVFPFETILLPDGRFMAEVYDISYTPGFTINYQLAQRKYQPSSTVLAVGNPDYRNYHPEKSSGRAFDLAVLGIKAWADLPGTDKELQIIRQKMPKSEVWSGTAVSETKLKQLNESRRLSETGILHFALHGLAGPASVKEDNSLVLTEPAGSSEDGLLQFFEATNLNIHPSLVSLSACETGISQLEDDGSMVTMGTAFLAAGAKAVLATNWTIDDDATAIFFGEFYDQVIRQNIPFAEALANTKRKFIRGDFGDRYKAPYFWAPFKYIGN